MLKIISYNIWFSKFIFDERLESLIKIINYFNPHVICLQEVTPISFNVLKTRLYNNYIFFPNEFNQEYDSIIIIKIDNDIIINKNSYRSIFYDFTNMGRKLHYIKFNYKNIKFLISNSHFESVFNNPNLITKYYQYRQSNKTLLNLLSEIDQCIFCFDSNLTKNDYNYFNDIFKNWIDCWILKNDDELGYTYDTTINPYCKKYKLIRERIDRILISKHMNINSMMLINKNSISDKIKEVSDHFGLYLEIII